MTDRSKFARATANGSLQSLVTNYNANLDTLEQELENTLNRKDDVLPNSMEDVLDMNSNRVINMADALYESDAVTKRQLDHSLATYQLGVVDKIDFYPTPTDPSAEGRLMWNNQDGTLDLGLKGGQVVLQLGQEQVIRVVNKTGGDLLKANYQCVKISGAQGQRPKVGLALANNDFNSTDTIGLVAEDILENEEGFVTTSGLIRNLDTTGAVQGESWIDGDVLYLSGTVAGKITNIKPSAPTHTIIVGFVIHTHANQGSIFIKVDNGYEIDELHNVNITAPVNGQALVYDNGLWENTEIAGDLNYYHVQTSPSTTWTVIHSLNKYPSVTVIDSAGTVMEGDVSYTSLNQVVLTFQSSFSGSATFN